MSAAFTLAGENGRLTLAVPAKGRMAEPTLRLCADAGLSFEVTERSLVVPCANAPVDLLLVRPSDIPEYAQDGVVDLGITGANLVAEAAADVETVAELGFARCTLDAAVPVDAPQRALEDLDGLRMATAYPASTERLLGYERDEILGRLGGVFRGTVVQFQIGQGFFVADAFWLPPDGEPIGPMALEVSLQADAAGATRVRVTQTGFEESVRWRRYYEVIGFGWTRALASLKSLLEK